MIEIIKSYITVTIFVKQKESLIQRFFLVRLAHFLDHDGQELVEVNRATVVLVNRRDQVRDVIPRWLEAKRSQGDFELLGLDGAASARIEQVKRVFDLLLLRLGEIGLVGLTFLLRLLSTRSCLNHVAFFFLISTYFQFINN